MSRTIDSEGSRTRRAASAVSGGEWLPKEKWEGEMAPGELIPTSAIADGIAFLVSDAARHISGSELDIAESRAATWN